MLALGEELIVVLVTALVPIGSGMLRSGMLVLLAWAIVLVTFVGSGVVETIATVK